MNETFDSVWDAIEDSPAEAENMKLSSALMTAILEYIKAEGLTQKLAAKRLGVTPTTISDLKRGRIDLLRLEILVGMLGAAGFHVEVQVRKAA